MDDKWEKDAPVVQIIKVVKSMGIYVNPSGRAFEMALNSAIYVDKTGMLAVLDSMVNTDERYVCISRPRRFGKTLALKMLAAYYGRTVNNKAVFSGTAISSHLMSSPHAGHYDVISLTMTDFISSNRNVADAIKLLKEKVVAELIEIYPDAAYSDRKDFFAVFNDWYKAENKQVIVLIDEWDACFRERKSDSEGQREYLDFLRDWLKDKDYIALAYMTGILPIKKYGRHSALNMFREFSMEYQGRFTEYTGFTADDVRSLCLEYNMDYGLCRQWYDGYLLRYRFRDAAAGKWVDMACEVYNPLSVVEAVRNGEFRDYWNKTETYEALKKYIEYNYDGLKEKIIRLMSGENIAVDTSQFSNDMVGFNSADDILTLLIHLGYLGYDSLSKAVFIPNEEINCEFTTSVKGSKVFPEVAKAIANSNELMEATVSGNARRVAALIEAAHMETSHLQYNDENALAYTVSLAYYTAREKYTMIREMPSGKGFADVVLLPRPQYSGNPAVVVELKWNHSARTAIKQIKDKEYPKVLKDYHANILLVGISYNKSTKQHMCIIENA